MKAPSTLHGLYDLLAAVIRVSSSTARLCVPTSDVNWFDVWPLRQAPPTLKVNRLKMFYGTGRS